MGAPILWAPGFFACFLQENLCVHKIPRFRGGGGILGFFWGGGVPILFLWARGFFFSEIGSSAKTFSKVPLQVFVGGVFWPISSVTRTLSLEETDRPTDQNLSELLAIFEIRISLE